MCLQGDLGKIIIISQEYVTDAAVAIFLGWNLQRSWLPLDISISTVLLAVGEGDEISPASVVIVNFNHLISCNILSLYCPVWYF